MKPLNLDPYAPWRQRYRQPIVLAAALARRNAQRGLAFTNISGIFQLHAWDTRDNTLAQRTFKPAGVLFGGISPDGRWIYYLNDEGGNEIGHLVRIPFEGGDPEDLTPDLPPYASWAVTESLSGGFIGLTAANADGFSMFVLPKDSSATLGTPQLIYRSTRFSAGPLLSFDGDYAVIETSERDQYNNTCLMAFRIASADAQQTVLVLQDEDASLHPVAFAPLPGDTRLLASTNASGFDRPVIWDTRTGDRTDIALIGMEGSCFPWDWSPSGQKILVNQVVQAAYQLHVYDLETSTLTRLNHPPGTYSSGYFASEDEIYVTQQDALNPHRSVALDAVTGEFRRVVLQPKTNAAAARSSRPCRSVTFTSSGGQPIQAWLATPEGEGPFPTILHTHGGPTAVQTDIYFPDAQAWLDHGFAWMSVNYRGSISFGRQFEQAIWGHLGELEVDDMVAARDYLVRNGIALQDAVILTGASYGGYLTLQALGKHPALWAGGMAEVAIADWALMYEDMAETLRGYLRSLFGGTPDELQQQIAASSPITYVQALAAPVLIIQGKNDTRCPSRQMETYVQRAQAAGKSVEIHWFEAGHGAFAVEQNIEHQEIMLRWVYRILG